jgi:hypothetical protein
LTDSSAARRVKTHRTLSLLLSFLVLVGWTGFAYSARSAASAKDAAARELAVVKAERDRWAAERSEHRQTLRDLAEARAQASAAKDEAVVLVRQLEELRAPVVATGSLEAETRIRKADRPPRPKSGKPTVQ